MRAVFDKSLRTVAKPALEKHGFKFDGRRKFNRIQNGKEISIEFQLGQRFMQGKFTVNIAIDDQTTRLGIVRESRFSRFVNRLFGRHEPWWKGIFLPKDKWWKLGRSASRMDKSIVDAISCIEKHGLPWLYRKTTT